MMLNIIHSILVRIFYERVVQLKVLVLKLNIRFLFFSGFISIQGV